MKLYVDDIRNAPDESWMLVRTINSAIRFIEMYKTSITHISLDHDISHQVQVGSLSRPYPCEETFQAVAHYIGSVYSNEFECPEITVHSANPVGANSIADILKRYELHCKIVPERQANRLEMTV